MEKKERMVSISMKRYDELIGLASAYGVLRDSILHMSEMMNDFELEKCIHQEIDSCVWFIGQQEG